MDSRSKIIDLPKLPDWRRSFRSRGRLVVTNGCFDILHAGHVLYLEAAAKLGDGLLIGLNGDEGIRRLKGSGRPINPETDRAVVLAALACVDAVAVFPQSEATEFLRSAEPDIYVKGGDYTLETLNQDERSVVQASGGDVRFIPVITGRSTSAIIDRIRKSAE